MFKRPPADLILKHVNLRTTKSAGVLYASLLVCIGGVSYEEAGVISGYPTINAARDAILKVSRSPALRQLHSDISVAVMREWHIDQVSEESRRYIADSGGEGRMIDLVALGSLAVKWATGMASIEELRRLATQTIEAAPARRGRSPAANRLIELGGCGPTAATL